TSRVAAQDARRMEEFRANHGARIDALRGSVRPIAPRSAQPNVVTVAAVVEAAPLRPPEPDRVVKAEALASIAAGVTRDEVLTRLGEPASRYGISGGDDGNRESFTYRLDSGDTAIIDLVDGKVTALRRK